MFQNQPFFIERKLGYQHHRQNGSPRCGFCTVVFRSRTGIDSALGIPRARRILKLAVLGVIKAYQWTVSPLLGPACRFYPSCSEYAHEAIQRHGMIAGSVLAVKRVLRCHPWHPGGVDPVPGKPPAGE